MRNSFISLLYITFIANPNNYYLCILEIHLASSSVKSLNFSLQTSIRFSAVHIFVKNILLLPLPFSRLVNAYFYVPVLSVTTVLNVPQL